MTFIRKSKIVINMGIFLVLAAIFYFIMYFVWHTNTLLAEMHNNVKQTGMIASSGGFTLEDNAQVEIHVISSVYEGDVAITLQNEEGEILFLFDSNCSQSEKFSLEAGKYYIRIDSDKFRGKFDIVVRKDD